MKIILSFVISFFVFLGVSQAETLKIMSWNIANLAAENGISIRDNSHKRTDDDLTPSYISACTKYKAAEKPIPKSFKDDTNVLTFQNIYPSDHCPILIELDLLP